jgi:hypothetical protein
MKTNPLAIFQSGFIPEKTAIPMYRGLMPFYPPRILLSMYREDAAKSPAPITGIAVSITCLIDRVIAYRIAFPPSPSPSPSPSLAKGNHHA